MKKVMMSILFFALVGAGCATAQPKADEGVNPGNPCAAPAAAQNPCNPCAAPAAAQNPCNPCAAPAAAPEAAPAEPAAE